MSGHKRSTVRLSRNDLRRLDSISDQLRQVESDSQRIKISIQEKSQQQRQELLDQFNNEIRFRQFAYQNTLSSLDKDIVRLEQNTNFALQDQADFLCDRLLDQERLLTHNSQTLIEQYVHEIHQTLQQNQTEIWEHFQEVELSFKQEQAVREQKSEIALMELEGAGAMIQSFDQVYDHEQCFPGTLDKIKADYARGVQNFNNDMPEAALLTAQQCCQQVSILRMSLEEILQKNALTQMMAVEKVRQLQGLIEQNEFVNAVDLEGNALDFLIEVNFWTSGDLERLSNRCLGFLDELQSNQQNLDTEIVERMMEYVFPQLEQSLHDIVSQARLKVIMSQIRYNIAETIINELETQGFMPSQAVYENQDERKPYLLISRNLDGSEVHVHIDSINTYGEYNIQVDTYESFATTRSELQQRSNTIFNNLRTMGLSVNPPSEVIPHHRHPEAVHRKPKNFQQTYFQTVN